VLRRVECRRFGGVREEWGKGRRQGLRLLCKCGAGAVAHGARASPPWGTTLGLLPLWATALEILSPCPTAGTWPQRPVQLTVGVTPNAVPHGGGVRHNVRGTASDVHFSKIFIRPFIFFLKSWQNKYKKICVPVRLKFLDLAFPKEWVGGVGPWIRTQS
jgi:hypothetical protein